MILGSQKIVQASKTREAGCVRVRNNNHQRIVRTRCRQIHTNKPGNCSNSSVSEGRSGVVWLCVLAPVCLAFSAETVQELADDMFHKTGVLIDLRASPCTLL